MQMEAKRTISQYIVKLLSNYEGLSIDSNHVSDGSDQYGLFKSPSRELREMNDGSCEITEYYNFMARQSTGSRSERKESDEWLEDLTYWADDFSYTYAFPALDRNRTVTRFSITGNPYPMEASDKDTLYQMALSITYLREREVS